ncbi:MAG TPA: hypothetical protein VD969_15875 [Symbiobacteriaceae bacterium]|nr:hypothetical protein [Symbiobacteriaceae bacterium]
MRMQLWLAIVAAGVLLTAGHGESKHSLVIWDRTPPRTSTFSAGTLALAIERGGGDTSPGPLFYGTPLEGQTPDGRPGLLPAGLLAPGDAIHRSLVVRNTGTLDAVITGISAELTGGSRMLADRLQVLVTADPAGAQPVVWGPLSEFLRQTQFLATGGIELKQGSDITLYIWVTLPLEAGNEYQALRSVVSFSIRAEQRGNNNPPPPPVKPPQLG